MYMSVWGYLWVCGSWIEIISNKYLYILDLKKNLFKI